MEYHFFAEHPVLFILVIGLISLLIGSFLNVVIYRVPVILFNQWRTHAAEFLELPVPKLRGFKSWLNLVVPRSRCQHCDQQINAYDNIPIFSFMWLGGKCRGCRKKISWQYPAIELLTCVLSMMVAYKFGISWYTLFGCILTYVFIVQSFIDLQHKIIPDEITLLFLWIGLYVSLYVGFTNTHDALLGAIYGYLCLWIIHWSFYWITGKQGMGYGDFKLLAMLGAWFGWQALPMIILLSSFIGSLIGVTLILLRRTRRDTQIPFGPFIAGAGWIFMLYGKDVNAWYLRQFITP